MSTASRLSPAKRFFYAGMGITIPAMAGGMFLLEMSWLWSYLLAVNVTTFCLFAYDKFGAARNWLRVPETTLHLFTFFGGTPAALAARKILRHKTIKRSFLMMFWVVLGAQFMLVLMLWWFLT